MINLNDQVSDLSSDAIWGAASIARFLNCSEKRVYDLVRKKQVPVCKIGGQLFTTRRRLQSFLDERMNVDA